MIKEDLKQAILEAAKKLFLQKGYANTSMRKIAAEVGISATAIYLYYKDKAEVMHAVHREGFKLLNNQFTTLRNVADSFERLRAMGLCYVNFALEHREYYEIMFIMKEPLLHLENKNGENMIWEEGEAAFGALVSAVEACQKDQYFKGYDSREMALVLWGNLHGLCALENNGHLKLLIEKLGFERTIADVIHSCFDVEIKMIAEL